MPRLSVCWQNTCSTEGLSSCRTDAKECHKQERMALMRTGVGGWILRHQAELSDLLIKEKHYPIWTCQEGGGKNKSEGSVIQPLARVMLGLDRRVHS